MFNHLNVELPTITATTTDGVRLYETPDGKKYPSITTVLSARKKEGLFEWRKKVGNEVANYVAGKAARRGTKVHHMCEDYLNNMEFNFPDEWEKHKKDFLPYCLFGQLKDSLTKVDNIHAQEAGLYSDKYRVAGRVDCIAEYDGVLSIIDFKTSTKERNDDWNENYYIQCSAYAEMYEERTGTEINQIVILCVTEDGTVQEFVKEKYDFLDMITESVAEWREKNETPNNNNGGVSADGLSNN